LSELAEIAALCPSAESRNVYNVMVLKQALVARFGPEKGFRAYAELLALPQSTRLTRTKLAPLREFAARHGQTFAEIYAGGERFGVAPPRVVGPGNHRPLEATARSFFLACLHEARISSGSAVVEVDGHAVYDVQGDELEASCDQLELDPRIFAADGQEVWAIAEVDDEPLRIREAFGSLIGPHAAAFGHWLAEYLPKYVAATTLAGLPPVPVLIDADMPPTHRQALESVLVEGTEIVVLPPGKTALVERLWYSPGLSYWPLLHRPEGRIDAVAVPPGRFRTAFTEMRRRAEREPGAPTNAERIYLARRPHLRRKLVNADRIEALARTRGFYVLYPEDLSFVEQLRWIRGAREILASDGSAILLALFARPGTKLCILSHRFPLGWVGFASMAEELDITIFTGKVERSNDEPGYPNFGFEHHADYHIDEEKLSTFLKRWAGA
jgi:hypothetical protein